MSEFAYIRRLFEGVGVLFSRERALADPQIHSTILHLTLGCSDPYGAIESAATLVAATDTGRALANALGLENTHGRPLAERRRLYAEASGVTERTLYRQEAKALPMFRDAAAQLGNEQNLLAGAGAEWLRFIQNALASAEIDTSTADLVVEEVKRMATLRELPFDGLIAPRISDSAKSIRMVGLHQKSVGTPDSTPFMAS